MGPKRRKGSPSPLYASFAKYRKFLAICRELTPKINIFLRHYALNGHPFIKVLITYKEELDKIGSIFARRRQAFLDNLPRITESDIAYYNLKEEESYACLANYESAKNRVSMYIDAQKIFPGCVVLFKD